jgi:hypothetical protein
VIDIFYEKTVLVPVSEVSVPVPLGICRYFTDWCVVFVFLILGKFLIFVFFELEEFLKEKKRKKKKKKKKKYYL